MKDDIVDRLYLCLVEELRQRGHRPDRPLTVSELYRTLVPYPAVRSALGVELNGDYEHALLRLLAGEGEHVRLEPEHAREELRREAATSYPFVGLFRKFADAEVRIRMPDPQDTPDMPERADGADDGDAGRETRPAAIPFGADAARPRRRPRAEPAPLPAPVPLRRRGGSTVPAPAPVQLHREPAAAAEHELRSVADCGFCSGPLPAERRVRFCPHCGADQRLRPCPRCAAVLEATWRYCIGCGHEVGAS